MALDLWICTNFCSVIVFYCKIDWAECFTRDFVVLGNCTYLECRSRIRQAGMPCGGVTQPQATAKPGVLWSLVYLVPVIAGCDRSMLFWLTSTQAASCSSGLHMPIAECGRMVPAQLTHSAMTSSTAPLSCRGPWLRISSAFVKRVERLGQSTPGRSPPSPHRGDPPRSWTWRPRSGWTCNCTLRSQVMR